MYHDRNKINLYEFLDNYLKGGINLEYKIGDLVRIKDNLQEGEEYGACDVSEGMLVFRGTLDFIENIDEDGNYHLTNNNYTWSKGMLELVAIYSCRENKGE